MSRVVLPGFEPVNSRLHVELYTTRPRNSHYLTSCWTKKHRHTKFCSVLTKSPNPLSKRNLQLHSLDGDCRLKAFRIYTSFFLFVEIQIDSFRKKVSRLVTKAQKVTSLKVELDLVNTFIICFFYEL